MRRRGLLRGLGAGIATGPLLSRRASTQADGREEWAFETDGEIYSSPTVVDGTVYVGSNDNYLYAVDVDGGEEEWRFNAGGLAISPTVVDGTVYAGSDDYNLYAVDAGSGEEEWRFEARDIVGPPTVVDGTVYVGSDDDNLYAVDAGSGEEEWRFETGGVVGSPTVADGTVYVGSRDNLYAVDAASSEQEWAFETEGEIFSSPTVVDGTVYVGSLERKNLYAVDAGSGEEEWRFETRDTVGSPTVADGTVYVGSADTNLYAVGAASGTEEWMFETGGSLVFSSPTVADGTVYVGSNDFNLYAVEAASGEEKWAFETEGEIFSSPTVVDGTVYVGSIHNLYAVEAEPSPSPESPTRTPTPTPAPETPTGNGEAFLPSVTALPEEAVGGGVLAALGGLAYAIFGRSGDGDTTDGSPSAPPGGGREPPTERSGPPERAAAQSGAATGGATEPSTGSSGPARDESVDSRPRPPLGASPMAEVPSAASVASPPRRPALDQKQLTVVEEIGAGGQAIITEARVPEAQQPPATVALREPDTSATLTREAVEEFLSQAETWATVDAREREKQRWADSEHIVGVVAVGDRQPWLAMEYMDGGDLEELLAEHPDGLPVGQALWTAECVCKGLEIAHQLGRAHLDVKPGNVLLRETDGWPWPKLADWGLARTLATETGTMDGLSVAYAGPEQFDSETFGDPDQLTDIYQTGALVYALLTGEPPATGGQLEVMKTVIGEEPVAPPSERRAELPLEVDAVVGLALEREKTDRYSSVSVFGDALHALRTGGRLPPAVAARLDE
jgi:outer membrane protein assembly factor BamB